MKIKLIPMIAAGLLASAIGVFAQTPSSPAPSPSNTVTTSEVSTNTAEVMPLITIEEAPLTDAMKTLARQAGINFQFDPKVLQTSNAPTVTIRFENVTALQALTAVLDNYNLQLTQDPKTKIGRVTVKEAPGLEPLVTRVVHLHYSNPTNVIPIIKATFGSARSTVIADTRTSQLVIVATEKEMSVINDTLVKLDTSPSQILIEGRFLETTQNPKTAKGINWTGTLEAQTVRGGNVTTHTVLPQAPPGGTNNPFLGSLTGILTVGSAAAPSVIANTASGFGPLGFLNADGLRAVISFLNQSDETQTLATPRAVALEGTPTELSVVQDIPIFEEQQGAISGGVQQPNTSKPNYKVDGPSGPLNEVGVRLMVTPRIYGISNIFLDLKPEISELGPDAVAQLGGGNILTSPTFIRKRIVTEAMVPSGSTLVLGGLREDGTKVNKTKVPLLGDIPGLGVAFRSKSKERNKRDLLIFITPTILNEADYQSGERSRDFLQRKPSEPADVEWSEWDSTKPHDWTQPVQ